VRCLTTHGCAVWGSQSWFLTSIPLPRDRPRARGNCRFPRENARFHFRALPRHFQPTRSFYSVGMIERKHLRIVRAVQRVVAAARELTEAERALKAPPKRRKRAARDTDATAERKEADR